MLRVRAQGINYPLHTPTEVHRLGAFRAKDHSCSLCNEWSWIDPWTVFWKQLALFGPTLHLLAASLVTSLHVVWKQTSHSSKLPGASIWSSHTMRNNPFQFSFSLPLPLTTKANFYDFHRSLQWALLLTVANSPSSLTNSFTFKPTVLLWLLFSSLQQPPIP